MNEEILRMCPSDDNDCPYAQWTRDSEGNEIKLCGLENPMEDCDEYFLYMAQ